MLDALVPQAAATTGDGWPDGSRHKIIAILGSHPTTVMQAPFGDESAYIVACSPDNTPFGLSKHRRELPRVDLWMENHDPIEHHTRPFGYLQYISKLPRLMLRDKRALTTGLFPNAVPYPEKELYGEDVLGKMIEQTGPGVMQEVVRPYPVGNGLFNPWAFSSSIAYILAWAIVQCEREKIPAIGLWGILQSSDNEYAYQRPGTQYFLWEAARRGIKVMVAPESNLAERPAANW